MKRNGKKLKVFDKSTMNKNPRLYKYLWRVLKESDLPAEHQAVKFHYFPVGPSNIPMTSCIAVERKEQLIEVGKYIEKNTELLNLFEAMSLMKELEANKQPFVAIFKKLPRLGILNPKHEKWENYEFAPAFDDDSDPIVDGFK